MESTVEQITLVQAKNRLNNWWKYILSKWIWIGLAGILFGLGGIYYASIQKPVYIAELTFAAESDKGGGGYASLASQFGIEMGGGAFEGENLIELLKSRLLIDKTFLTEVQVNGKRQLLIEYYIDYLTDGNKQDTTFSRVTFSADQKPGYRLRDSMMKVFYFHITKGALGINKIDKRLDIISAKLYHRDERFAKLFIETLTNNAIQYYVDYKIKKAKQNVEILQRQTDSLRRLISGGIISIAQSNDLNINPTKQVLRTNVQRRGVDVQVNTALYSELVTNLEASRIAMRKETPFIQIIDSPILPLEKNKLGRLKTGLIFAFAGGFLTFLFFILIRLFKKSETIKISQL